MKFYRSFGIIYLLICLADLLCILYMPSGRIVSKPLILSSLIVHFIINVSIWDVRKILFCIGLASALLGDILLLFEGELFFLLGLASFLLMQILYSITFYKESFELSAKKYWIFFILVLVSILFVVIIWSKVGNMRIPILGYAFCITLMAALAFARNGARKGYNMVTAGSLFFICSDQCLAWSKFASPFYFDGLIVMATYATAQFLICIGLLRALEADYR